MSNSYFQFKQFIIHQDKTAMRVCTDACLFGAIIAEEVFAKEILDIGSGTGLLSLMYSQKHASSRIDAIELEENAFKQTKENFAESIWESHLTSYHTSFQNFSSDKKYDLIISNPPFFENDLKSAQSNRNLAMHSETLTLKELFFYTDKYLCDEGKFALLIPYHRLEYTLQIAEKYAFFIQKIWKIKQTETHGFFRVIIIFQRKSFETLHYEISIKNVQNQYSVELIHFLKDYYLFL